MQRKCLTRPARSLRNNGHWGHFSFLSVDFIDLEGYGDNLGRPRTFLGIGAGLSIASSSEPEVVSPSSSALTTILRRFLRVLLRVLMEVSWASEGKSEQALIGDAAMAPRL